MGALKTPLNSSYDDDESFQAMDYEDIRKNYEIIGNVYENPELLEEK
ncbi:TPA: YopX family protein [Streptococcus pneumoniae]|nr:YopX family protein [Streptococcus pneumoniae]